MCAVWSLSHSLDHQRFENPYGSTIGEQDRRCYPITSLLRYKSSTSLGSASIGLIAAASYVRSLLYVLEVLD